MANHASALKRARQNEKLRIRNRAVRTKVRSLIKSVRQAIADGNAQEAQAALNQAIPAIDKAAGKGVYHRRNAARKVSRLTRQINSLSA